MSAPLKNIKLKMAPPASELKAMTDAFDGIDRLAEGAPRTDGAPNFRRVGNHCCGHEHGRVIITLVSLFGGISRPIPFWSF